MLIRIRKWLLDLLVEIAIPDEAIWIEIGRELLLLLLLLLLMLVLVLMMVLVMCCRLPVVLSLRLTFLNWSEDIHHIICSQLWGPIVVVVLFLLHNLLDLDGEWSVEINDLTLYSLRVGRAAFWFIDQRTLASVLSTDDDLEHDDCSLDTPHGLGDLLLDGSDIEQLPYCVDIVFFDASFLKNTVDDALLVGSQLAVVRCRPSASLLLKDSRHFDQLGTVEGHRSFGRPRPCLFLAC